MLSVVKQIIAGVRVQEYHQAFSIQRQPWQHITDQLRAEGQLATPVRMRADRAFVDAAHSQWKQLRGSLTQRARLLDGAVVELDVGVVTLDRLHLKASESVRTLGVARMSHAIQGITKGISHEKCRNPGGKSGALWCHE